MGFTNQSLVANEDVILKATLHPAVFVAPVAGMTLGIILLTQPPPGEPSLSTSCMRMLILLFILACLWNLLQTAAVFFTTDFAVTTRRVIGKSGLIQRHSLDVLLHKVESVQIHQSLAGRLFGFGTIIVTGSGGTQQQFRGIGDPMRFRSAINDQIVVMDERRVIGQH